MLYFSIKCWGSEAFEIEIARTQVCSKERIQKLCNRLRLECQWDGKMCSYSTLLQYFFVLFFFLRALPMYTYSKGVRVFPQSYFPIQTIAVNSCCYVVMQNDFGQRQSSMPAPWSKAFPSILAILITVPLCSEARTLTLSLEFTLCWQMDPFLWLRVYPLISDTTIIVLMGCNNNKYL